MGNNLSKQIWTPIETYREKKKTLIKVCKIRKLKKKSIAVSSAETRSVNFVLVNGNYKKMENT